jgi:hypothetical protein
MSAASGGSYIKDEKTGEFVKQAFKSTEETQQTQQTEAKEDEGKKKATSNRSAA